MVDFPLDCLPEEARRAAIAQAKAMGIPVQGERRRRGKAFPAVGSPGAMLIPVVPPLPGLIVAADVAEWRWREHKRCGWAGIGPCCFCE